MQGGGGGIASGADTDSGARLVSGSNTPGPIPIINNFNEGIQHHACGNRIPDWYAVDWAPPVERLTLSQGILVLFLILILEFIVRHHKDKPVSHRRLANSLPRGEFVPRLKWLTGALLFNSLCLLIRYVHTLPCNIKFSLILCGQRNLSDYRARGRVGRANHPDSGVLQCVQKPIRPPVFSNENSPDVLDGMMIVFAMYTFNIMHPGRLLRAKVSEKEEIPMEWRSTSNLAM